MPTLTVERPTVTAAVGCIESEGCLYLGKYEVHCLNQRLKVEIDTSMPRRRILSQQYHVR